MATETNQIEELTGTEYKYGFETHVETETFEPGLNEDIVRRLSAIKHEPEWLLEFRLKSFRAWQKMVEPTWHNLHILPTNYQALSYYSAPKKKPQLKSLDEVDPEVRRTFEKLGIPLEEQMMLAGVAVDAVFDSVSVGTTFRKGPNNTLTPAPGDPGSPWAIGSKDGGHDAVHPDLGTQKDFAAFVKEAGRLGIEVALDLALQASPDHPAQGQGGEEFPVHIPVDRMGGRRSGRGEDFGRVNAGRGRRGRHAE